MEDMLLEQEVVGRPPRTDRVCRREGTRCQGACGCACNFLVKVTVPQVVDGAARATQQLHTARDSTHMRSIEREPLDLSENRSWTVVAPSTSCATTTSYW